MIWDLDQLLDQQPDELRAVVLSALPDGLVAWAWTRDGGPVAALEFAALDRAATACLGRLQAPPSAMTLSLITDELRIFSRPLDLRSPARGPAQPDGYRLIANFVFDGATLPGLAMAHSKQLCVRLREALLTSALLERDTLREALIRALAEHGDPPALLARIAEGAGIAANALAAPGRLPESVRERVALELDAALA
ncbi:hypothetical protein G6O69_21835 [Pseudenhygromyxa sp. WMMC2535]|uniref:hypothetical protein n=1 Tax=Pseudenhygromyxa sp. WMMC2535 TaxID=2712867 RepID=UPI0015554F5A|nr:hypothetical protein [Pseudenhygromyxa sp. WMMC2535]NVB40497.1 hypothetical protein [Pseudenhygromyxa sp. WMMC2535]